MRASPTDTAAPPSSFSIHNSSFPPSPRDLLAYERIIIDGASTRQAAEELKISQTRVRQLLHRVAVWLEENLPAANETRQAAQIRLAQHIAAERLHRHLNEAQHAWQQTREAKYVSIIIRLLTALSKIPAHPHTLLALADDSEDSRVEPVCEASAGPPTPTRRASEGQPPSTTTTPSTTDDPGIPTRSVSEGQPPSIQRPLNPTTPVSPSFSIPNSSFPSPPPLGACSPQPVTAKTIDAKKAPPQTLTPAPATTSQNRRSQPSTALHAFLTPAHHSLGTGILPATPATSDDPPTITQLQITPQSIALTTTKHSTRRDRRRLQRLLTKK